MPISESLVRGLKERFFADLKDGSRQSLFTLLGGAKNPFATRKNFDKWASESENKLGTHLLCAYHGGSKRNQYLGVEILGHTTDREFNSWKEKCLFGSKIIIHASLQ